MAGLHVAGPHPMQANERTMILCTIDHVPGAETTELLGLVRGAATRTRSLIRDITEWFRNLAGMELEHYTKMLAEAREQALERMVADARRLGADAVVGVRLTTNHVAAGAAEILAFGTAVRIRPTGAQLKQPN